MAIKYSRKIEKQADGTYLIGLRGEDEDSGRVTHCWRRYAAKPTLTVFKRDFTARQKGAEDKDIPGTSLKEQLDKWFVARQSDVTPKDETPKDNKVTFS